MIFTQNILNFTFIDWLILIGLCLLLVVQLWSLWRKKTERFWVKLTLNVLLWISVCLLYFNPSWSKSIGSNKILIYDTDIPQTIIQANKDSLKIGEIFSISAFKQQMLEKPDFATKLGQIYILGQDATPEILSKLNQKTISWIPYFKKDELQDISWNGLLRKGEIQEITGKIELSESKMLKIKFGNRTLDSVNLAKGFSNFALRFPTFAIGRNELSLSLDQDLLQNIAFFTTKNQAQNILFILTNPDFESKTLADWLGRNGNKVETVTTVAKNTQNKVSINNSKNFTPNIIITDPSNASNSLVKKTFSEGKSVLFINVENPDLAAKNINQNLGTKWSLKRLSNENNLPISQDLTAQPYAFQSQSFQKNVADYPVSVQKRIGKIGFSLLNETFPIMLSGDSLTYAKIWNSIFYALNPSADNNIVIEAPIFQDVNKTIIFNSLKIENSLHLAKDTIQTLRSAINPFSAETNYFFRNKGWQTFQDSSEVYVEENQTSLAKANLLKPYLKISNINQNQVQAIDVTMPNWVWFIVILVVLTLLWIEPKLNF
jgi:hypothetical protein